MKTLCTLLLLGAGFSASAQHSSVSKHIVNNGQQLRIRVDIEEPGRSVHYDRSFDVSDLEKTTVKALEMRIIDSLEQHTPESGVVVVTEPEPNSERRSQAGNPSERWLEDTDERAANPLEASATSSLSPGPVLPSSVLVREDKANNRLWMQYTFREGGNELIIERTVNVTGKSERGKRAIISETERRFGIITGNQ